VRRLVEIEGAAGEPREAVEQPGPLGLGIRTVGQARRHQRSGVDHRVRAAGEATFHSGDGVERHSRGVHARRAPDRLDAPYLGSQGEDERLGHAHEYESPASVALGQDGTVRPDQREAEQSGIGLSQRGVDGGARTVVRVGEPPVRLGQEPAELLTGGETARVDPPPTGPVRPVRVRGIRLRTHRRLLLADPSGG
jgi:hypothetical protein